MHDNGEANLAWLREVEGSLTPDEALTLDAYLLGWLANATPPAMWKAGIEAWRASRRLLVPSQA